MFEVCLRRFSVGRDSLEVKKIIKVKFLWIIAATAGHFYEWEGVFLEKHPSYGFRGTLSLVVVTKCFHNCFSCSYLSKRWQSVSWDNLDSLILSLKLSFFNKANLCEVLWLLQWVSFSGKDYYVLLLVLLVLNKFIEINTLIKRNLNF